MAFDFGNALVGAGSGAYLGSAIPGVGTLFGAGVGALTGLFGGKKKKQKKVSTLDPYQKQLYEQKVAGLRGQGQFADLYQFNPEAANANFDLNVAAPAYRSFNENIVPTITGQFRQNNLQNSTYAGQALGRAGRDVQESLNAQRANMIYNGQNAALNRKGRGINDIISEHTFDYQNQGQSTIDQILGNMGPKAADWIVDNYLSKGLR